MPSPTDLLLDTYSPLAHKQALAGGTNTTLAPTWVGPDHQRRLTAYKILAAYRSNCARFFLPGDAAQIAELRARYYGEDPDADEARDRREYGDARLLIERIVAGVIGDDWQIVVAGADEDLPDEPDLPDRPAPIDDEPPPSNPDAPPPPARDPAVAELERRIHQARLDRWTAEAAAVVDEWEQAWASQPALQARQDWLRTWADDEFFAGKAQEAEGDAVGLGDGVYVIDLDHTAGRPRLQVYDPGFYFPVLDDRTTGFPSKIHIAWEFTRVDSTGATHQMVRRLTWELVDLADVLVERTSPDDPGQLVRHLDTATERVDDNGVIERLYPWAMTADGAPLDAEEPDASWSTLTCVFSDGEWETKDQEARSVDDFDEAKATWATTDDGQVARRLDLLCDFIPVVHVPNTPATRDHFGESTLLGVAQVLDDIHGSDTDREAARALASLPMVALHGKDSMQAKLTVAPGMVIGVGEQGGMDVLDLTQGLEQLRLEGESLLDRMNVNARVPAEVLGRVKASDVPSGIALALGFGPFTQLISALRLSREQKYPLLLKIVARMAQTAEWLPPGENPVARLAFGSFLPSDLKGAVEIVVLLLQAHGISRRTALQMLVDAGVDVGDVVDELDRIVEEDTQAAVEVQAATGSDELAAERLGLELPPAPPAPTVMPPGRGDPPVPTLPPVPPEPGPGA